MVKNLVILSLLTINGIFGWNLYHASNNSPDTQPVNPSQKTIVVEKIITQPDQAPQLINNDYAGMVAQLREAEYDETLLRQLVLATLNRDFLQAKINEIKTPYWQANNQDPEQELNLELQRETDRRTTLISLFGEEIAEDPMFADIFKPLNDSLPFLSSDKQIKLDQLQRRDQVNSEALFANGFTQEGREDLQQQRQNLQQQIEELLGTEDAFEYQLRESRLADRLRQGLDNFDYSEREFREIFSIREANEGVEFSRFNNRQEFRDQRRESEAQIRDYLGPGRYEDYARSQDPAYRSLQAIGERYGNTTAEINDVYEVTYEAQQQIDQIRSENRHDRDERRELIGAIRNESYEKIEQIAGEETASSIQDNSRRMGFGRRISPRP